MEFEDEGVETKPETKDCAGQLALAAAGSCSAAAGAAGLLEGKEGSSAAYFGRVMLLLSSAGRYWQTAAAWAGPPVPSRICCRRVRSVTSCCVDWVSGVAGGQGAPAGDELSLVVAEVRSSSGTESWWRSPLLLGEVGSCSALPQALACSPGAHTAG